MAITLPLRAAKKPSTLNGLLNGRLPSTSLVPIGVGNAIMEVTAARAFRAMFAEARGQGFIIKEVGDYRSYMEQLNLFLSRYKPVSYATWAATSSAHRKTWPEAISLGYASTYWIKKQNANGSWPATAAVPGTSNHGWGLALDIAEELDGDPGPESISTRFVQWLVTNARRYGIWASLQSEPWHWQYTEADAIPQAVLDYEQGTPPPVPPTPTPTPTPGGEIVVQFQTVVLKNGSTGPEVVRIQQIMNQVAGQNLTADGQFGAKTEQAVKNWQAWFKVPGGADGIVGAATWESFIEVWLATGKP